LDRLVADQASSGLDEDHRRLHRHRFPLHLAGRTDRGGQLLGPTPKDRRTEDQIARTNHPGSGDVPSGRRAPLSGNIPAVRLRRSSGRTRLRLVQHGRTQPPDSGRRGNGHQSIPRISGQTPDHPHARRARALQCAKTREQHPSTSSNAAESSMDRHRGGLGRGSGRLVGRLSGQRGQNRGRQGVFQPGGTQRRRIPGPQPSAGILGTVRNRKPSPIPTEHQRPRRQRTVARPSRTLFSRPSIPLGALEEQTLSAHSPRIRTVLSVLSQPTDILRPLCEAAHPPFAQSLGGPLGDPLSKIIPVPTPREDSVSHGT